MPAPFPAEFRLLAGGVGPERSKPISQIAADRGIAKSWSASLDGADIDEGKRKGPTTAEREELTRLRRENRGLRMERQLLSRAAASSPRRVTCPDAKTRLTDATSQQQRRIYKLLHLHIEVAPDRTLEIQGTIPIHGNLDPQPTGQLPTEAPRHP